MAKTSSNSPKYRDFFITINESAECYNDIEEIIKDLNINLYALIVHDKDILEQIDNESGELVQTPKKVMPYELAVDENGEVIEQLDAVYYVVDKNGTKVHITVPLNN